MGNDCLNFAEQERLRLTSEIEVLQGEIRLHGETKEAWNTIVRNAEDESDTAYLDLADSAKLRLERKIEAAQQKIRLHLETMDAWDWIEHHAGSESHIHEATAYEKGEDGRWHVRRLNREIETLEEEIRLHDQCKTAWDLLVRNAGSESQTTYLEFARAGKEQLDCKIEAAQEKIRCRVEIRDAWDTILRVAESESRVYHGVTYVMGEDRQWHLHASETVASNEERPETDGEDEPRTDDVSKSRSVWQLLVGACEKTLTGPERSVDLPVQGKQQFLSLGLR